MRILAMLMLSGLGAPAAGADWNALHGAWSGSGTVRGMPAEISLDFRPALEGRAHRLAFANEMRQPDGKVWRFLAEATYLCDAEGECRGHWYDSRGTILPVRARFRDAALVVEWGDAESERGRTTYAIGADGTLAIDDDVLQADGTWRGFGQTRAQRVDAD